MPCYLTPLKPEPFFPCNRKQQQKILLSRPPTEESTSIQDPSCPQSTLLSPNEHQHLNSCLHIIKMQTFSQLPAAKQTSKSRLFNTLHKSWIHRGDEMVQEPLTDSPPRG